MSFSSKSVQAVLFDMDGTLVDSDAAVARAWHSWARRQHVDHDELMRLAPGLPGSAVIRHFRPQWTEEEVLASQREQLALEYADVSDVVATPGAAEAVAAVVARGLPWAVVTSADRKLAGIRLGAAGISAPLVVARDDIVEGKPAPEGFLKAASHLGVRPEDCLVVEDAAPGVAAGKAAGMTVAALNNTGGDIALSTLHDLVAWLTS